MVISTAAQIDEILGSYTSNSSTIPGILFLFLLFPFPIHLHICFPPPSFPPSLFLLPMKVNLSISYIGLYESCTSDFYCLYSFYSSLSPPPPLHLLKDSSFRSPLPLSLLSRFFYFFTPSIFVIPIEFWLRKGLVAQAVSRDGVLYQVTIYFLFILFIFLLFFFNITCLNFPFSFCWNSLFNF